jgi:hypothetical protein
MVKSKAKIENVNNSLIAHAKSRSDDVTVKLHKAMATIEIELGVNDGIYPFNKGRLSMAEVCRRAGIHKITLQGEVHRLTNRLIVKEWLDELEKQLVKGSKSVRRRVTSKIDDWKARYTDLARSYNEIYAIEIVCREAKLKTAFAKIAELEGEVLSLRAQLSDKVVVVISDGKRRIVKSSKQE